MKVKFYATLRQHVGAKEVEIPLKEGETVRHLIDKIVTQYPQLRTELLDEQGNLFGHVHLFVNGRDTSFLEDGLDTALSSEDRLSLFPAVGGGRSDNSYSHV
jgi:molybdopterin synthase sulfur carrier subunit